MSRGDRRGSAVFRSIEVGLVALVLCAAIFRLSADVKLGTRSMWWGERLSFAAGMLRGVDIYPPAHSGVITGDVYGVMLAPFFALAALTPGITGKLVVGQLSSLLVMLIPLGVLVRRVTRAESAPFSHFATGMAVLIGMLAWFPATNYQLTAIAADAPCLGFGMASFTVLTGAPRPSYARLAAGAAFAALATLTKPNGAFMALAFAALVLYRGGLVRTLAFAALYAALTAGFGLLVIHATKTSFAGVLYNDVVIPSSQLVSHSLRLIVRGIAKLTLPMFALLGATLFALWLALRSSALRPNGWPVVGLELWFVAIVLVPISYLGRAKMGGDVNSFHAHYFAIAGTVLTWLHLLGGAEFRLLRSAGAAALAFLVAPFGAGNPWSGITNNSHERVYAYLRAHDDAYFPWHTLATLEATGHYFHNSDGVYSRSLAGRAPSRAEFMAHAPPHPTFIGLPKTGYRLPVEFVFAELVAWYYPDYALVPNPRPELAALGVQIFAPKAGN